MNLQIESVLGVKRATIDLSGPITLIAGPNRQGKSSVVAALRAALLGDVAPISGKRGQDGKLMVNREAKRGRVQIAHDGQARMLSWPDGGSSERGSLEINVSPHSLGDERDSLLRMPAKDRFRAFADLFGAAPNRADLDQAVAERNHKSPETTIPAEMVEQAWKRIEGSGWDDAQKDLEDEARTRKGEWRGVTGEAWGSTKGESWEPVKAQNEVYALEAALEEARKRAAEATPAPERPDGKAAAERVEKAREALEVARRNLSAAHDARKALPEAPGKPWATIQCPHCNKPTDYAMGPGGKLIPVDAVRPGDLKRLREEVASADGALARCEGELGAARTELQRAEAELASGTRAAPVDHSVAVAEARLEEARRRVEDAAQRAAKLHGEILQNLALAEICGPAGLRQQKKRDALEMINGALADWSERFGIPAVSLDDDLVASIGGVPWPVMSESEQWRAEAMLALEIATRRGHDLVVLDRADVLDVPGRNHFFRCLAQLGGRPRVVVAMTETDRDNARKFPDLAARGLGQSYWIENGVAEPHGGAQARAA